MEVWQDFGQKIDLAVRIRDILHDYPEGTSVLKEITQVRHGMYWYLFCSRRTSNIDPRYACCRMQMMLAQPLSNSAWMSAITRQVHLFMSVNTLLGQQITNQMRFT